MHSDIDLRPAHESIHVAVIRKVRQGHEADFESRIRRFFGAATEHPGVDGAYLVRPIVGSDSREYGILRSFRTKEDMQRFYESDLFRQWNDTIAPLVEGEPERRELHGLEAFFRGAAAPPRWKMAVITWLGVSPAVYVFSRLVPWVFGELPGLATLLLINLFVVASLTWGLMPLLTKVFRPWLHAHPS
jgi:uncharacterized protein